MVSEKFYRIYIYVSSWLTVMMSLSACIFIPACSMSCTSVVGAVPVKPCVQRRVRAIVSVVPYKECARPVFLQVTRGYRLPIAGYLALLLWNVTTSHYNLQNNTIIFLSTSDQSRTFNYNGSYTDVLHRSTCPLHPNCDICTELGRDSVQWPEIFCSFWALNESKPFHCI